MAELKDSKKLVTQDAFKALIEKQKQQNQVIVDAVKESSRKINTLEASTNTATLEEHKEKLNQLTLKQTSLNTRVEQLESFKTEATNKLEEIKDFSKAESKKLKEQVLPQAIEELKGQNQLAISQAKNELSRENDNLFGAFKQEVNGKVADIKNKIEPLEEKVQDFSANLPTLLNQVGTLRQESAKYKVDIQDIKVENNSQKEKLVELGDGLTDVKTKGETLKGRVDILEPKIQSYDTFKGSQETKNANYDTKITEFEGKIIEGANNNSRQDVKLAELSNKNQELERKLETFETKVTNQDSKNTELTNKLVELTSKNQELQRKLEVFESKFTTLDSKYNEVADKLVLATNKNQEQERKLTESLGKIEELEVKLQQSQNKIQQLLDNQLTRSDVRDLINEIYN